MVFLKLTALLCPTSDFRHSVATPAVHLLLELLLCPVATLDAVRVGLALCTVAYEVRKEFPMSDFYRPDLGTGVLPSFFKSLGSFAPFP